MPKIIRSLAIALSLLAVPLSAAVNRWSIHGPDGGGPALAFDPANSQIVFAAADTGIFRSADNARSWAPVSSTVGIAFTAIAVAPSNSSRIYASSTSGLYRSDDAGASFARVQASASYAVVVSSANADVIYTVSGSGPQRSEDGGVTLARAGSGLPLSASTRTIASDPSNDRVVYATFSSTGAMKTTDGGVTWLPVNNGITGITNPLFFVLRVDPNDSNTVYLGTSGSLYKTTNGGTSWSALNVGRPGTTSFYSVSITKGPAPKIYLGSGDGLFRGDGVTFTQLVVTGLVSTRNVLTVDPMDPNVVLNSNGWDVLRSENGAVKFERSSKGLAASDTSVIAADP